MRFENKAPGTFDLQSSKWHFVRWELIINLTWFQSAVILWNGIGLLSVKMIRLAALQLDTQFHLFSWDSSIMQTSGKAITCSKRLRLKISYSENCHFHLLKCKFFPDVKMPFLFHTMSLNDLRKQPLWEQFDLPSSKTELCQELQGSAPGRDHLRNEGIMEENTCFFRRFKAT